MHVGQPLGRLRGSTSFMPSWILLLLLVTVGRASIIDEEDRVKYGRPWRMATSQSSSSAIRLVPSAPLHTVIRVMQTTTTTTTTTTTRTNVLQLLTSTAQKPSSPLPSSLASSQPSSSSTPSSSTSATSSATASSAAPSPSTATTSPVFPSATPFKMTYEQFKECVAAYNLTSVSGFPTPPSAEVYAGYATHIAPFYGPVEQAMLLANLIWESGGFQYREELACAGTRLPTKKCPYGRFYGRGYIQLTWEYNYRAASRDIYGDLRLVLNPSTAATIDGSWLTAKWYWDKNVRPRLVEHDAISTLAFGYTVRAINGVIECKAVVNQIKNMRVPPKMNPRAAYDRLAIFRAVLAVIGYEGPLVATAAGMDRLEPSLLGCL